VYTKKRLPQNPTGIPEDEIKIAKSNWKNDIADYFTKKTSKEEKKKSIATSDPPEETPMEASINLPTEIASLQTIPISVAQEHHSPEKDAITDTDRSISAFLDLVRTEGLTRDPDPINSSQTDEPRPPDKTVRENIHTDETEETQLVTNAELMNNTKKKTVQYISNQGSN